MSILDEENKDMDVNANFYCQRTDSIVYSLPEWDTFAFEYKGKFHEHYHGMRYPDSVSVSADEKYILFNDEFDGAKVYQFNFEPNILLSPFVIQNEFPQCIGDA